MHAVRGIVVRLRGVRGEVEDEERAAGPETLNEAGGRKGRVLKVMKGGTDARRVKAVEEGVVKAGGRGRGEEVTKMGLAFFLWDVLSHHHLIVRIFF